MRPSPGCALLAWLLLAAACRPETPAKVRVLVPPGDSARDIPPPPFRSVRPDVRLAVPPGSSPRVLRPDPQHVEVTVPAGAPQSRSMKTRVQRKW